MPLSPVKFLGWLGALVVAGALVVTLSIQSTARLRDQAAEVDAQARTLRALREERATLATQQPSTNALEEISRDQATLDREHAALQEQRAEFQRASLAAMRSAKEPPESPHTPPSRATPQSTIHSTIAALNHGEAEELAGLIDFDPSARTEAENFFASLPPDLRSHYGSPEQLVAHVMVAKTGVILAASGDEPVFQGPDDVTMHMNFNFPYNKTRTPTLQFHRDAEGWKLRVPAKVIEGYRARVTGVIFVDTPSTPAL